jgi:hypothetical protein
VAWLRRLQIRRENYPNSARYRWALTLYIALAIPLVLINVVETSTLRTVSSLAALVIFTAADFGLLRRERPQAR